jgi:hypothetical protein
MECTGTVSGPTALMLAPVTMRVRVAAGRDMAHRTKKIKRRGYVTLPGFDV